MKEFQVFEGVKYSTRHGGPFDRGSCDSYYGRGVRPHFFTGDTYKSTEIDKVGMTAEQIQAYMAGYKYNEQFGDKKEW